MDKEREVRRTSNPEKALKQLKKYFGKNAELYYSTRKNKKYMIEDPDGKYIHFGFSPMEDFTYHQDKERRDKFRKRNKRWATSPKYSASYLSYWVLW